ncbi:MAG TPA: DUF4012 domain-containing protein [Candidatus Saccharimonadales bacterium]|nr:DUF4012 domain-containing protein [Candidatus Saccharimonadales bacterium]
MAEWKKVDFVSSEPEKGERKQSENTMSRRGKVKISKRFLIITAVVVAIFVVIILVGVVLPAQKTYVAAMATYSQAKLAYDAAKKQNIELAGTEIKKTQVKLAQTQKELAAMGYIKYIPLANNYYNDADHLLKAGADSLDAANLVVTSLKPYTDVLGLKGKGSFVMGSAEDRIRTAVATLGKITPNIDAISVYMLKARAEIDQVDPNHYPDFGPGAKIRNQLTQLKTYTDQGVTFVNEARPLIKVLPALAGDQKEKKYLIIFQNDKELRPTGGFITAYAVFKIDKGLISVEKSEDIYELDAKVPHKPKAPAALVKYLPQQSSWNLRDTNISPDYIESMKTFKDMYNSIPGATKVDGIIALDTHVLVSTIKILDNEIQAGGLTFTTDIDKRCNCPQVIYALENEISRPVGYIKSERKALLGQLLYAIMQKALKSSPKIYWGPLMQDLITQAGQKHVLFDINDSDAQSGLASLNVTGQIKPFEGDYLHINEANLGGQKSNLFVQEVVSQNIETQSDGTLIQSITINYKNPQAPSDCNLERGALCLNAVLRDWIRVYVPKGSTLLDSKGSEVKVTTYEDLGKTVFDGFVTVRPLGAAVYTLKYRLPFKVKSGEILPYLIQKQPGTTGFDYTVNVNGKQVDSFPLLMDKELKIKL